MNKCKICKVEADTMDGRCRNCAKVKAASDAGVSYGKFVLEYEFTFVPNEEKKEKKKVEIPKKDLPKCAWCEKPVKHFGRVTCGDPECRRKQNNANARKNYESRAKEYKRICRNPSCKAEFHPVYPGQAYCSPECRAAAAKAWQAKANENQNRKRKEERKRQIAMLPEGRKHRKVTAADMAVFRELHMQGLSDTAISNTTGHGISTISAFIRKWGIRDMRY